MARKPRWNALPDPTSPRYPHINGNSESVFDDDDDHPHTGRRRGYEQPTNAGMIGVIFALVSLGLLLIVVVLYYALSIENAQQDNPERTRLMAYWFMFLDIASFFSAVTATIFAGRGLSPTNPLHRGWSLAALITGILEIVGTALVGFVLCCWGLILVANGG